MKVCRNGPHVHQVVGQLAGAGVVFAVCVRTAAALGWHHTNRKHMYIMYIEVYTQLMVFPHVPTLSTLTPTYIMHTRHARPMNMVQVYRHTTIPIE